MVAEKQIPQMQHLRMLHCTLGMTNDWRLLTDDRRLMTDDRQPTTMKGNQPR
jgi:hypothetical protein